MSIAEQFQDAIRNAGESRYGIAKRIGVSQATLCRVLSGERGLSFPMIDRLLDGLELEIVIRPRRKARKDG